MADSGSHLQNDVVSPPNSIDFLPLLENDDVFPFDIFNHRLNQVTFVMDLINQRIDHPQTIPDHIAGPNQSNYLDVNWDNEIAPEFVDREIEFDVEDGEIDHPQTIPDHIVSSNQSFLDLDLHSDFTTNYNYLDGNWDNQIAREFDVEDGEYRIVRGDDNDSDDLMLPLWDSLALNERNAVFDWEEIGGIVNEGDAFVPVLSQEEERGGELWDVEWEDLINRELYLEDMIDRENAGIGKPPASEREVQRLGIVVVSQGDLETGNVICAVCKEDMDVGEKVREMPCGHRYHGDCILPWLRIRNTCPVCRFELKTADPDYERTSVQRVGPAN